MGILDSIVEWIATQVMNLLDLITGSVLGALGCDMNASVNVQVNVVHSPSAVVRGDYESDLANCLNPSNSTDLDPTSQ